jgi:hypothetical protein
MFSSAHCARCAVAHRQMPSIHHKQCLAIFLELCKKKNSCPFHVSIFPVVSFWFCRAKIVHTGQTRLPLSKPVQSGHYQLPPVQAAKNRFPPFQAIPFRQKPTYSFTVKLKAMSDIPCHFSQNKENRCSLCKSGKTVVFHSKPFHSGILSNIAHVQLGNWQQSSVESKPDSEVVGRFGEQ